MLNILMLLLIGGFTTASQSSYEYTFYKEADQNLVHQNERENLQRALSRAGCLNAKIGRPFLVGTTDTPGSKPNFGMKTIETYTYSIDIRSDNCSLEDSKKKCPQEVTTTRWLDAETKKYLICIFDKSKAGKTNSGR